MRYEIRRVTPDDLPAYAESVTTGFLERTDVARVVDEFEPLWDLERTWAAFDGARVAGTFRSWATDLTLPGATTLPAAAVAGVTVLPTHRRQGILRGLVAAEHGAARERDEAVAILYASEYPIYGRFGYGPASPQATWTLDALATGFHHEPEGSVELVPPGDETREAMTTVFETWRRRQPGEIGRRDFMWEFDLGIREFPWAPRWKGFVALHRDAEGRVDGYARYHAEPKREQRQPRTILHVDELHALNDAAYLALWRFLAEVDLVATVRAEGRKVDERLPWLLTNARAAAASDLGDALWVRLLDVPRALEARAYEGSACVVLEVVDAEVGDDPMRVELDAGPDGARALRTTRSPDLTVDVAALGAALLGGTRLRDAVLVSGADEHRGGALADADALLATRDGPWCSTFF